MKKFGLYEKGELIQEYEGDDMSPAGEYVHIYMQRGGQMSDVVATIRLAPGQSVKLITFER